MVNIGNPPNVRCRFLSVSQRFLPFIQRFLACVQLRFPLSKLLFSGQILFLAGADHRKRDEHQGKKFFHIRSKFQLVFRNWEEANGEPMPSQMKLNARSESGGALGQARFLREFFPNVRGPA